MHPSICGRGTFYVCEIKTHLHYFERSQDLLETGQVVSLGTSDFLIVRLDKLKEQIEKFYNK